MKWGGLEKRKVSPTLTTKIGQLSDAGQRNTPASFYFGRGPSLSEREVEE